VVKNWKTNCAGSESEIFSILYTLFGESLNPRENKTEEGRKKQRRQKLKKGGAKNEGKMGER
jgi:hypothetical protein